MERIIRDNKDLGIFCEFYPLLIERMGYTAMEFAHMLFEDWGFSVLAMDDHKKKKMYARVKSAEELVGLCRGGKMVNLLLETR